MADDRSSQVRHDVLAVVHTLVGAVELLLTTRMTARQRRYVNVCKRSAENLIELSRKLSAHPEERTFQRLAIDDLTELGVKYLAKPVTRAQLISAVRGVDGGRRLRILAADDSPDSCALIDQFLKGTAKRVDVVNDGLAALQQYQRGKYDLLIIDLDMPVMDGRTAIREIRAWETDHKKQHVAVIVLTAHDVIAREVTAPAFPQAAEAILIDPDPEIAHLVPGFLSGRRQDVQILLGAIADSNYDAVRTVGHMLKGTGGGYGCDGISVIGGRLEEGAERQDYQQVREAVSELATYLDRARISDPALAPPASAGSSPAAARY
jgi:CheY-like chemotaxis protein